MNTVHLMKLGRTVLLLLLAGCNTSESGPHAQGTASVGPASASSVAAVAASASSGADTASAPSPVLAESLAQALLDTWVKAQNQGDFASYQALYASKVMGIKRVGKRSTSFDREGWLADRQAMFKRPVTVTVEAQRFIATPGMVVVSFKQTWQSPTFKDVGDKRLVLVSEGGRLVISREEMLDSDVAGATAGTLELGNGFSLIKSEGARKFAILSREVGEEFNAIVAEHPIFLSSVMALRPLAPALMPAIVKAALGQRFRLYGPDGMCESTATNAWVLAEAYASDNDLLQWEGWHGNPRASQAAIATSIWRLAAERGRFLVVELAPGCGDVTVARLASLPLARAWYQGNCGDGVVTRALSAFRALPRYKERQAVWRSMKFDGFWEGTHMPGRPEGLRVACYGDGSTQYVALSAIRFTCSEGDGELWAIYKVQDPLVRLSDAEPDRPDYGGVLPKLGLDVDGDGLPEFFDESVYLGSQQGIYRLEGDVLAPVFGCRC